MSHNTITAVDLTIDLINRDSVTPQDKGCQERIAELLEEVGFTAEYLPFEEVQNLWIRKGTQAPLVVFAGHTDVVPTGPIERWDTPPFTATIKEDGYLYGRGAADMKTGVAAFTIACREFVQEYPQHKGSIALLITSDEEGPSINGTVKVCETLEKRGEQLDYCIVGEPTSDKIFGDTIKNGRRGSLTGTLTIKGKQGHVAYPEKVRNPIHLGAAAIAELVATTWDNGNDYFPATSFQISNYHSGTGATNVVPYAAQLIFNFRFSTESTPNSLKQKVHAILDKYQLDYDLEWVLGGSPFLTEKGKLTDIVQEAIFEQIGVHASLSTTGGTSDGRFIAKICPQILEFGPINATIHQVNECVAVNDITTLKNIYKRSLEKLLLSE
ncbi:succinyl-diaminopimelate desuccinylase [Pelistega sp. NLN82]|uniref:Succinyl-diaminopimelate desuccinylase n=1 Tax=Pelistega ratti TaxID=2652177 RepID=A0A6L9Y7T5_9BURK|nr:succinyl-diaminopimelate desuccinylase [Pelistega ratti]NEN76255.1 succinyl-diaminopimelate desuccinylase [Pelistega ratti]